MMVIPPLERMLAATVFSSSVLGQAAVYSNEVQGD